MDTAPATPASEFTEDLFSDDLLVTDDDLTADDTDEAADGPDAAAAAATAPAAAPVGPEFVHLHLHSDYSMLDGACQISRLCERVKALGQKAVAVTDHGNMFGAMELYRTATKQGLQPIIGCEFYTTPSGIADRSDATRHHLVLLAKDFTGYQTLCHLNRIAWSVRTTAY